MGIYDKYAYAAINRFVAADLAAQGLLEKTVLVNGVNYSTMMPAGQSPEVNDSVDPALRQTAYIVYGLDDDNDIIEPFKMCESLTYSIFAPTVSRVSSIVHCIQDLMHRQDWTIFDIERWKAQNDASSPFRFLTIEFEHVSGLEPVRQEGGRYASLVGLHYEYCYNKINGAPGSVGQGRIIP